MAPRSRLGNARVSGTPTASQADWSRRSGKARSMKYSKGDDYLEDGTDHKAFGISREGWGNQIEVYGDAALRDRIIELLNKEQDK